MSYPKGWRSLKMADDEKIVEEEVVEEKIDDNETQE